MSNNTDQDKSSEKTVTVRVNRGLADEFKRIAKSKNRSQALLIRDFMIEYVENNGK